MKSVKFQGYTIYEDGTIIGLYGKEIKQRLRDGRYEVAISIEGKRKNFTTSRLVYYAFHPFDITDKNLCVSYKDENTENIHLDNLYLSHRKDLIQGDKHVKKSLITDEQAEEIRSLWSGKVGSNQHDKVGHSLNDLAKMYGVSKGNISMIIKGRSRNEEDYKLK